jgi:hypothetical protein
MFEFLKTVVTSTALWDVTPSSAVVLSPVYAKTSYLVYNIRKKLFCDKYNLYNLFWM